MKRFYLVLVISVTVSLFTLISVASQLIASGQSQLKNKDVYLKSFDLAWNRINDTYPDPAFDGIDWARMYKRYRPQVEKISNGQEFSEVLNQMIGTFNRSHFFVLPESYFEGDKTDTLFSNLGTCGFDIRHIEGKIIVSGIHKDPPPEIAEVKPGWEVISINNEKVRPLIQQVKKKNRKSSQFDFELISVLKSRLTGSVGESGPVEFNDGKGKRIIINITLKKLSGHYIPPVGNLPPSVVNFNSSVLPGNIGYIQFDNFSGITVLIPLFNSAMEDLRATDGLILDLRGNPGGIGAIALSMAGWFVPEKEEHFATLLSRKDTGKVYVRARMTGYSKPLVVLVDELTASSAEFLAGGLKDIGRATLIGNNTAGYSDQTDILELPSGDRLIYLKSKHLRLDGTEVEGTGIKPDIFIHPTKLNMLDGRDLAIEAASDYINKTKNSKN